MRVFNSRLETSNGPLDAASMRQAAVCFVTRVVVGAEELLVVWNFCRAFRIPKPSTILNYHP